MDNKIFYQDFLFNQIEYINDFPNVNICYYKSLKGIKPLIVGSRLFDYNNVKAGINLSELMNCVEISEWNDLIAIVRQLSCFVIIDDIKITNFELIGFKEFFLKTYVFLAKQACEKTYVYCV